MLFVLSPAKTLDETPLDREPAAASEPLFAAEAERIANVLGTLPTASLRTLLSVSAPLATLNAKRYAGFSSAVPKCSVFAFNGPAYKAIEASSLTEQQLGWVNARLRVLCGLYGAVRPLDRIKPYRLEMGSKLDTSPLFGAKTLYAFWGERIAIALAADIQALPLAERCLVNVASQEYWASVKPHAAQLGAPVYTMVFATSATVYAKAARGAIVRFAAERRATRVEELKAFTGQDGSWSFDAAASDEFTYTFRKSTGGSKSAAASGAKRQRKA
jgi:cytoplasmic iron level regulating protein YaaA (DUF328/UPF0246 family)